ncbi:MAG: IS1595 family transposase [Desulfovibrio sp.]|nr:IS1595 family transposase [Desulfovibrio sp.]
MSADDKKTLFDLLQNEANDFIEVALPDKPLSCPSCGCVEWVLKNGKRNGVQRYLSKKCNKSFMANTNTILERTHKPLETCKKFLECMVHAMSVLKTAEVCEINKNTAFIWRHKVLDALFQLSNKTELNGIVEADETFFVVSYKGQKKHLPREAKKRATPAKKRGLSAEQVCVPCGLDRTGKVISKIDNFEKINHSGLAHVFGGRIKKNSVLYTDKASAYRKFSSDNYLQLIQLKGGKYKLDIYNINHINAYHSGLKTFIRPFKGISTKYLNNYLTWNIYTSQKGTIKEKTQTMLTGISQANIVVRFNEIGNRPSVPIV